MADPKFHPAITVNNIKNLIPITLEMEKGQYSSWAELFKIHCRAYQVIDHIIPTPPPTPAAAADKAPPPRDEATWSRLDAIVLQWIYSTISNNLLHTILEPDSTAHQAWERLKNIFQDNKNSRAVYLENQFTNTHLDSFPNVSSYCQELKMLADQLSNVGAPVSNQRLVLQLIAGLNDNYDGVATIIQQTDPLPPFYEARSKLILEETRKSKQATAAANAAATALLSSTANHSDDHKSSTPNPCNTSRNPNGNNSNSQGRGRGYNNNHSNTGTRVTSLGNPSKGRRVNTLRGGGFLHHGPFHHARIPHPLGYVLLPILTPQVF